MPLAAVLLRRGTSRASGDAKWVVAHLGTLFGGLFAGFLLMNVAFTEGVVAEAARMQFEPHPFVKLLWFARNPRAELARAVRAARSVTPRRLVLARRRGSDRRALLGFVYGAEDAEQRRRWLFAALLLPFVAHSVSLAASSQAIGYRTLLPLSGLFLVLFAFGLRASCRAVPVAAHGRSSERSLLCIAIGCRARAPQRADADRGAAGARMATHPIGSEPLDARARNAVSISLGRRLIIARRRASTPTNTARCRPTPRGRPSRCSGPQCGSVSRMACPKARSYYAGDEHQPRRSCRTISSSTCASS